MTLAEAEKNYSGATIMSMLELVSMEAQCMAWNAKHPEDKDIADQLEAIQLIKAKRIGKE